MWRQSTTGDMQGRIVTPEYLLISHNKQSTVQTTVGGK